MNEQQRLEKNNRIKQKGKETRLRRLSQDCKVYELKLDKSHLSKAKQEFLHRLFLEAKWLYNYQLSNEIDVDYKLKEVDVLNKDKILEQRDLDTISAQIRQTLVNRTKQNIFSLSKSKKKGNKIGGLKFKSYVNCIPLSQFGITYRIENNNKYIHIQGFKKHFKILGLDQIPEDAEFANANLIRKLNDYYLKVTTFLPKQDKIQTGNYIGLDFGIKDNVVDSNRNKYNFSFPETRQLKKLSRKLNKCKRGSKNKAKLKFKLGLEYEKINNRKKDAKNKFVSKLINENDLIAIQDESIHQWKSSHFRGFGRKIHYSILGGITSSLKHKPETLIIPRTFPSTQLCPNCGSLNKHSLDERIYVCDCGYSEDRDIHSARNILNEGLRLISMEHRNPMLDESETSRFNVELNPSYNSLKQEAIVL